MEPISTPLRMAVGMILLTYIQEQSFKQTGNSKAWEKFYGEREEITIIVTEAGHVKLSAKIDDSNPMWPILNVY